MYFKYDIKRKLYEVSLIYTVLSRDLVIIDGVWIGNRIYWTFTTRNYK
jgi:hypothetical protein